MSHFRYLKSGPGRFGSFRIHNPWAVVPLIAQTIGLESVLSHGWVVLRVNLPANVPVPWIVGECRGCVCPSHLVDPSAVGMRFAAKARARPIWRQVQRLMAQRPVGRLSGHGGRRYSKIVDVSLSVQTCSNRLFFVMKLNSILYLYLFWVIGLGAQCRRPDWPFSSPVGSGCLLHSMGLEYMPPH